jgi:hypothetical protein
MAFGYRERIQSLGAYIKELESIGRPEQMANLGMTNKTVMLKNF